MVEDVARSMATQVEVRVLRQIDERRLVRPRLRYVWARAEGERQERYGG